MLFKILKIKEEKWKIILIDTEKILDTIQHPFMLIR